MLSSYLWDYRLETLWIVAVDLAVFFLIGLGPALILLPKRDPSDATEGQPWELAPCLGFAMTLIASGALIELGLPVGHWWYAWLALAGAGSLGYLVFNRPALFRGFDADGRWSLGVILATPLMVIAPVLIGGAAFAVLRGNAWDTFNYIEMAYVLDELPYRTILQSSYQQLADQAPEYAMGRAMLHSRWQTSAVLAFCSHPAGVSVYRCEYAYPALMFLLAAGPAFRLGRKAGLGSPMAALAALALTTGFYAQVLLDLRAFSHANSLPLLLLGTLAVVRCPSPQRNQGMTLACAAGSGGSLTAVAVCTGALLLAYQEIVPFVCLAGGIGMVRAMLIRTLPVRSAAALVAAVLAGVVLALPCADILFSFMRSQLNAAVTGNLPFHEALFPWLLKWSRAGAWGLNFVAHIPGMNEIVNPKLTAILLMVVSIPLCMLLVRAIVPRPLASGPTGPEPPALTFLCAFLLAGAVQCVLLFALHKMYPACKGFLYAMPFALIALPAIARRLKDSAGWQGRCAGVFRTTVMGWLAVQCLWSVLRIGCAAAELDYVEYSRGVSQHPYYRQHDLDLRAFETILAEHRRALGRPLVIKVVTTDFFLNRYLTYTFRRDRIVLATGVIGPMDGREVLAHQHGLQEDADFVIVPRHQVRDPGQLRELVTANEELALLRVPRESGQQQRLFANLDK
jgi:hypothetical protein